MAPKSTAQSPYKLRPKPKVKVYTTFCNHSGLSATPKLPVPNVPLNRLIKKPQNKFQCPTATKPPPNQETPKQIPMSYRDQATAAAIARIATACDGAVIGIAIALCAVNSWIKYVASSSALRRVKAAPFVRISDLRSVLGNGDGDGGEGRLVVVRGGVQAKSSIETNWKSIASGGGPLLSQGSAERAVVLQETQTCIYNEWRGLFGWSFDLHAIFAKSWKEQRSSSLRSVPFILVEGGHWPNSGYVHVSLDGLKHPLPLTTVYHHLHPVQPTPYSLFQAVFGNGYPVALLDEEKILPVGKEITAVGICKTRDGDLEIKPCQDLPCFLSEKKKDEIEVDLAINTRILFWSGIVLGTVSIAILGYAVSRNWRKWKEWKQRQRQNQSLRNDVQAESGGAEEESGDIPDGQLCVICLLRQRRSAFVPCGHLVCCSRCAMSVELDSSPKCPVCRQTIRSSIRIYDS